MMVGLSMGAVLAAGPAAAQQIMGAPGMHPHRRKRTFAALVALLFGLMGSTALAQAAPQRQAYFGETHIHTSYSLDAWTFGDRKGTPGDSYKYLSADHASGRCMRQASDGLGQPERLATVAI
jgi:hypothetical protein